MKILENKSDKKRTLILGGNGNPGGKKIKTEIKGNGRLKKPCHSSGIWIYLA